MLRKKIIFVTIIPVLLFGIWDADTHNINNWVLSISNYGRFDTGIWLPESIYFFGAGLSFGSISPLSETLVTVGLDYSGSAEYGPGLRAQDHNSPIVRIYMSPNDWPADSDTFPMAPQLALTQQESWSCYNDFDSTLHQNGKPIGIEVYQTTFADTLSPIADVIFLKYEVKNCTTHTINDAIVTVIWYQTLPWNGLILNKWFYPSPSDSFFVEDLGYCYDDSTAIGILFIKTPDDSGCSAYKTYPGPIAPNTDPTRYMVMAGYNYQTGIYNPYDSLPHNIGWAYMSSGKFALLPGETKDFIIALISAYYINNDTLPLAITAKNAKNFFLDSLFAVYETDKFYHFQPNAILLSAYPNPFRNHCVIKFQIPNPNSQNFLKIYDVSGRMVRQWDYKSATQHGGMRQEDQIVWDGTDKFGQKLPAGVYFVRVETKDYQRVKKVVLLR